MDAIKASNLRTRDAATFHGLVAQATLAVSLVLLLVFITTTAEGQFADSLKGGANSVLIVSDSVIAISNDLRTFHGPCSRANTVQVYQILFCDPTASTTERLIENNGKRAKTNVLSSPGFIGRSTIGYSQELDVVRTRSKASTKVDTVTHFVTATIDSIEIDMEETVDNVSLLRRRVDLSKAAFNVDRFNMEVEFSTSQIGVLNPAVPLDNVDASRFIGTSKSQDLPSLTEGKLAEMASLQKVNEIQATIGDRAKIGGQLTEYQEDLSYLKQGDLASLKKVPEILESKAETLDGMESLQKTSQEFAALKAKWADPETVKEQALNKAKETAVNHFAGREEELKSAMEKLSKLKTRIPDPEGALDLFAKRQQFMKEKKLMERFVPGLALQFQKQESYWVDLNPYLGFKITGRWLAGLGWNERIAYNFDDHDWDKDNRIYGLRSFLQFKLKEKIWLKSDVEYINGPVYALPMMTSEIVGRERIWSFFAGIKKDMEISKRFRATLQTMYNIYNPDKRSPYVHRLNIRIGFELPLKNAERER